MPDVPHPTSKACLLGTNNIRLLSFDTESDGEEIKCVLRIVPLSHAIANGGFHALFNMRGIKAVIAGIKSGYFATASSPQSPGICSPLCGCCGHGCPREDYGSTRCASIKIDTEANAAET
jgi:hypothetical protein